MLISIIIGYGAICLFVFLMQYRLLYYPHRVSLENTREGAMRVGLALWPVDGAGYHGFVREPAASPAKGTVVVFHGNAGTAADRSFYADALCPLGYRVLLIEYPAYGAREGRVGEASFVASAAETLQRAAAKYGEPLFVMGESLGAAVGAAAAVRAEVPVAGVAAITPWHNLPDLAQSTYPFLPAKWLARDRYHNAENLNRLGRPVAVCIAEKDTIVAPKHGTRLFDDLQVNKRKWTFQGAGHNSWPVDAGFPWWEEVMNFLAVENTGSDR